MAQELPFGQGRRVSPLEGDALPFQKPQQLSRGPKKRGRQKASKRRWEETAAKKSGPCRVCGGNPPNELHHIVSRAQGGPDTEANIVPLCSEDHGRITAYDRAACAALRR